MTPFIANMVVAGLVLLAISLAIRSIYKAGKKGKKCFGCSSSDCSSCQNCNRKQEPKEK